MNDNELIDQWKAYIQQMAKLMNEIQKFVYEHGEDAKRLGFSAMCAATVTDIQKSTEIGQQVLGVPFCAKIVLSGAQSVMLDRLKV